MSDENKCKKCDVCKEEFTGFETIRLGCCAGEFCLTCVKKLTSDKKCPVCRQENKINKIINEKQEALNGLIKNVMENVNVCTAELVGFELPRGKNYKIINDKKEKIEMCLMDIQISVLRMFIYNDSDDYLI